MEKNQGFPNKFPQGRVCHPYLSRLSSHSWVTYTTALRTTVATTTPDHTVATIALDTTFASVAFAIPLVALLTPSPVMWRKENFWNVGILQRVHLHTLV
jgi:hypothetical protein